MSKKTLIEEAKDESIKLLKELQTEKGFVASSIKKDNYRRVWSRDGIITGLASLTIEDDELIKTFEKTLNTLRDHQDETGRIPSNVSLDEKKVSYGTTVGRIDATLWYIIGVCKLFLKKQDKALWSFFEDSVKKAIFYLKCLELNGRGLIYVPGGGDWADEYLNTGYVLYDEALYAIALSYYYQVTGELEVKDKLDNLLKLIDVNFFPSIEKMDNEHVYHRALFERACKEYNPPLPVNSFNPFDIIYINDIFATSLVFNLPINTEKEMQDMESKISDDFKDDSIGILPAFYPTVKENDERWWDLQHNYLYEFKNKPYEFHNGGRWSLVHGFYLASKSEVSLDEISSFAEILKSDDYKFHEFFHGQTGESMGTERLGFSAAGFLLAYTRFKNNKKPFDI